MAKFWRSFMCRSLSLYLIYILFNPFNFSKLFCDATAEAETVKVLTDENFDQFVKDHRFVLVKFYADWCVHCKNLAPEYEKAAKTLADEKSEVVLAKVKNEDGPKLMEKFSVKGFPTLVFFKEGASVEYTGTREAAGLVDWVKDMQKPTVEFLEDKSTLPTDQMYVLAYTKYTLQDLEAKKVSPLFLKFNTESVKNRPHAKFYNLDPTHKNLNSFNTWRNTKEWEHWKEFAKHDAGWTKRMDALNKKEHEWKTKDKDEDYVVYHPGEGYTRFEGTTEEELTEFFAQEMQPLFSEIDQDNYMRFITAGLDLGWFCGEPSDYDKYKEVFLKVARALRGEVLFVWVNSEKFQSIKDVFLVTQLPSLAHQTAGGRFLLQPHATTGKKYSLDKPEAVLEFYLDVRKGVVPKSVRSEEEPKDNSGPVKVVVGNTLEKFLKQNKNVLLMIHAPHCQHCKNFLPVFQDFATSNKDNDSLVVASFNGDANESTVEEVSWDSFPTLLYFKAGERVPVKFAGERTTEGLREFVVQNGGQVGDVYTEL